MERETLLGLNEDESINLLAEALAQIDPELPYGTWFDVRDKIKERYGQFAGDIFYYFADLTKEGLAFTIDLAKNIIALQDQQRGA